MAALAVQYGRSSEITPVVTAKRNIQVCGWCNLCPNGTRKC